MNTITHGWILTRRELAHWVRQPWAPIFSLSFTIMLLIMFAVVFGGSIQLPGGGDYVTFLVPGMMALTMMFGVEGTMMALAADSKKGITDRFRSMPIGNAAVGLGRIGADLITSTVELAILMIGGAFIGWRISGSPIAGLLAVALLLWLRFGVLSLGIYLGLTIGRKEGATMAVQVLVWPIGFLSNAFVSPEFMPSWLGAIAAWNPISATATAVRQLFGNPTGVTGGLLAEHAVLFAIAWPAVLTAIFLPLAARAYRNLRK